MASFFGSGSQDGAGGVLGNYQPWQNNVGLLGAALKDAGASFSGHPADANSLQQFAAQLQQRQQRQQLMQGLLSDDPAARQTAYTQAALLGVDTKPFEQQQAQKALPALLQSMKATPETGTVTAPAFTANLPKLPGIGGGDPVANNLSVPAMSASGLTGNMKPGLSFSDALQAAPPELQSQYAPRLLDKQIDQQFSAVRPATAEEKQAAGLNEVTPAQVDANGKITPITDPNQITAYQNAELKHQGDVFGETKRHNLADEANSAGDAGGGLSDEAKVNAAVKFNLTGILPPFGMGKAARGDRLEVLNYAAQMASGKTSPEQLVTQAANFKANSASLNQQTKQFNSIEQNANTAKNSINLALASAKAGGAGPTDSPVFNRWVQAGRVAANGDPQVQSLQNHLSAFAEDYAKVMTANTSAAGATDSARGEAYKRLSAANSVANLQQISGEMMKEMGGRHYAARAQIGAIQKQLGGGGYSEPQGIQTAAPPQPISSPAALPRLPGAAQKIRVFNPATGRLE